MHDGLLHQKQTRFYRKAGWSLVGPDYIPFPSPKNHSILLFATRHRTGCLGWRWSLQDFSGHCTRSFPGFWYETVGSGWLLHVFTPNPLVGIGGALAICGFPVLAAFFLYFAFGVWVVRLVSSRGLYFFA